MKFMITKNKISLLIIFIFISGCNLSPGMHMKTESSWLDDSKYVYIDSIDETVKLVSISETLDFSFKNNYIYRIGIGDQIDH